MQKNQFSRTELLIGKEGQAMLAQSTIMVFGVGGVGSFTVEALVRAGVGNLILVDFDDICVSNLNRQIHALHSTIGEAKVEVMKRRILDINPNASVETIKQFYTGEDSDFFFGRKLDYVVDAIDSVASKVKLAKECLERKIPFISSMGAGNRLSAGNFKVADIAHTSGCPLAKAMRKLLRQEGITQGIKVVFSPEPPLKPLQPADNDSDKNIVQDANNSKDKQKRVPGSISFVPSVVGLLIAGEIVKDLLDNHSTVIYSQST